MLCSPQNEQPTTWRNNISHLLLNLFINNPGGLRSGGLQVWGAKKRRRERERKHEKLFIYHWEIPRAVIKFHRSGKMRTSPLTKYEWLRWIMMFYHSRKCIQNPLCKESFRSRSADFSARDFIARDMRNAFVSTDRNTECHIMSWIIDSNKRVICDKVVNRARCWRFNEKIGGNLWIISFCGLKCNESLRGRKVTQVHSSWSSNCRV